MLSKKNVTVKKKRSDKNSIFEYLNRVLGNPELRKQYIQIGPLFMILDWKLKNECANGQKYFFIKKLENELSGKIGASILAQKSSSPMICRPPSQFTFTKSKKNSEN